MKRWLSLIRSKNLLMVAATQGVVWWALSSSAWDFLSEKPVLIYKVLLVLSTVAITAGGYLINDWYDVDIDAINKPQKAFLLKEAHKKQVHIAWIVLSLIGLLLAILPARAVKMPALLSLQVATVLALWWYAAKGKRLPVIGNVLVALLTALSMELPQFYVRGYSFHGLSADLLALFAFLLTWMREIVKDLQDEAGDRAGGCKTLPILAGRKATVWLASILGGITLLAVLLVTSLLTAAPAILKSPFLIIGVAGLLLGVAAPLFVWVQRLWRSHLPSEYASSSGLLKIIMVVGLMLFVLFTQTLSYKPLINAPTPSRFPKSAP